MRSRQEVRRLAATAAGLLILLVSSLAKFLFSQRESRFLEKSWLPSLVKGIEDSQIRTEAWTVLVQLSRDARLREIMSSTQTTETVVAATAKLLRKCVVFLEWPWRLLFGLSLALVLRTQ